MKARIPVIYLTAITILAGTMQLVLGEVRPNPYHTIIDRNAFALKPPPPPPDPEASRPPPPPPSNVKLTGIHSMFGKNSKRAMLEILETGPGKLPKKPTLKEGERDGNVEVVSIDVEKGLVKILNNGIEAILGFTNDVAKSGPVSVPGYPAGVLNTTFQPPSGMATPANIAVPLPGANADSGRTKVAVSSGSTTTSSGPTGYGAVPGGATSLSGVQSAGAYTGVNVSASAAPAANPGYNNIPTRNLRVPSATTTSTDGSTPPAQPQYSRQQIELLIEAQRLKAPHLPFPPTSLNPNPTLAQP